MTVISNQSKMNLSGLLPALRALPDYANVIESLGLEPRSALALNLPRAARPAFVAALASHQSSVIGDQSPSGRAILVITARHDRALALADEIAAWLPISDQLSVTSHQPPVASRTPLLFGEPNPLFYEPAPWGQRAIRQRISVLASLTNSHFANRNSQPQTPNPCSLIVSSARALMTRTVPKREFLANARTLKVGAALRVEKLLETWVGAGYEPQSIVVEPGQFSRRGGIIDVFPPADPEPVRIELFGDEVESLRRFDPATQRSGDAIEAVTITPAREAMPKYENRDSRLEIDASPISNPHSLEFRLPLHYPASTSLLDYLPDNALVIVDDWAELANTVEELETQAVQLRDEQIEAGVISPDFPLPYLPWAELQDDLASRAPLHLGPADDEQMYGRSSGTSLHSHFSPGPRFGGQLKPLLEHLERQRLAGAATIVVTRQAARLAELWAEHHSALAPAETIAAPPAAGSLTFVPGALAEGFTLRKSQIAAPSTLHAPLVLHLLTDSEIFGWSRPEPRRRVPRRVAAGPEADYADFAVGDYVVHVEYGIGRFGGLVRRAVEGLEREYLFIEYDAGDELYVPIHQADRLTRYVGTDDRPPSLSRLGTAEWASVRERAQHAAIEAARELLELYAQRELAQGHAFAPDAPWQKELEGAFPYLETEDQLKAIAEVKADMEKPRPMDRLICGDVGYGKTEVALRAAFKAVMDGKQVALLVPTTILAQQHYNTFAQRLAPYPVSLEMLSRFRSPAEQRAITEKLATGEIDIVIGTHRLIQKDVKFRDLGLLIIDEEQRFGVTHKERLKQMRTEVDVLTLTATPIPRTLYLSLTGVRDISTINTPPDERLPIVTQTGPYTERLVRQAVLRELDRDGQVFYVHNRVQTIGVVRRKLERLLPEARIGVAHGQMEEHELAEVMQRFTGGEIDVLLSTSIIESGLDIPNANTLIVDRADMFGLAQLYQLRGRVGRGANRAYAYFLHDKQGRMTVEAHERLDVIGEQTALGAGYGIAMRDLEMRGAGDLLGVRQHGHIAAVGFHLYTRLLRKAIQNLKSAKGQIPKEPGAAPASESAPLDFSPLGFAPLDLSPLDFGVSVDLPIPTILPTDYVPDRGLRLQLYRRLAELTSEQAIADVRAELAERFGPPPEPVENLLFQLRVKLLAARAGVESVAGAEGQIVLKSPLWESEEARAALAPALGPGTRMSKKTIWLARAGDPKQWRKRLVEVLERLGEAQQRMNEEKRK